MPATIIHDSWPSPPVRIYAGKKKCGPDGKCEQVATIISEFMPPYNIIKPLADKILEWAGRKGCQAIVALEGTHALGDKKKDMIVYGIASTPKMKGFLKKYNLLETKEGMITGLMAYYFMREHS